MRMSDETTAELRPPEHLDEKTAAVWRELVGAHHDPARIVGADFDAYCGQVALQRDARARIARDGVIVEDERGRPTDHPAIALERDAQREIRNWGDRFRPKVGRGGATAERGRGR